MKINDLIASEYNPYYKNYIDMVSKDLGLIEGFEEGLKSTITFFESIPEEKLTYIYAADKWTVKEIFQHIIDTERIFMYRCLRIARRDTTMLPGFEQNDYIEPSKANFKSLNDLLEEYKAVRYSSIIFLKSLNDDDLMFIGNANGSNTSARAAAFSVLGHELWHMKIIKERYL